MQPDVAFRDEDGVLTPLPLRPTDRRNFLRWSGVAAAALLAGCQDSPLGVQALPKPGGAVLDHIGDAVSVTLDFSNDFGVLNYAYALEQLEAAYYIEVVNNFAPGLNSDERDVLRDLRAHEIVHREFYAAALGANAIPRLNLDFSSVDFGSRRAVLRLARSFEDTGVGAYNGAAKFLENGAFLLAAGQIVSVEARHASVVRTLLGNQFAPRSFDEALAPSEVLSRVAPFVVTEINLINVPAT